MTEERKRSTAVELPDVPTLEDILRFVHGGDARMLLKAAKFDDEGRVVRFGTAAGERAYSKLVALVYGLGALLDMADEAESMVAGLDAQARNGLVL